MTLFGIVRIHGIESLSRDITPPAQGLLMSTILFDSSLPPSVPLKYSIEGCSSYSVGYHPENILEDKPDDASSRWSTERSPNPEMEDSQWVTLKLEQPSIVTMITFGKYMKNHPCNVHTFRVYGGLGTTDKEMHELLSGKLKDDHIPQTFMLNFKTAHAKVPFPCRYIKICPIAPHTKSYNMSIWHVSLNGISNPRFVSQVQDAYFAHKDTLALHLILKHLRRNNFSTAYQSLLEQTNIRTEHPSVTQLHDALVVRGDLVEAEHLVKHMAEQDGLFNYCARVSKPMCVWKRLVPRGEAPIGRGGHQLCLDEERGLIYLFGGWDGSRNLADFWSYSIAESRWSVIHHDTAAVGGPSARSCHNMVYNPKSRTIYVLGQLKEAPRAGGNPQPQPSDADFFKCAINAMGGGAWTMLNPTGVEAAGGPPSISDHQMVIDEEKNLLYVFGGRVENLMDREGANLYSGMYTFNLGTETWSHIFNDPARQENASPAQVNIYSRTGHGMVLYPPTHEIFIVGGRRTSSKWISDMHSFVHSPLSSQRLAFDPAMGAMGSAAPRVCIDGELGEIYILIWQNNDRDRLRAAPPEPVTFATYHIEQKRWVRSEPHLGPFNTSAIGDVWEGLELPRPRSAHQVVYDSKNKVFYMFGGNSGEDGMPRLNDLWSMKLVRPTVQDLLRKALLAVRKFRFKDMCHTVPPFEALGYLQKEVTEVTDNDDEDEAAELRGLLSYLLSRTSNGEPSERVEVSERKARRELFDFLMQFVAPSEREPETELRDILENI